LGGGRPFSLFPPMSKAALVLALVGSCGLSASAFSASAPSTRHATPSLSMCASGPPAASTPLVRRSFLAAAAVGTALPLAAEAKREPPVYQEYAKVDMTPPRPPASEQDVNLPSGVSYKEYKPGQGDAEVGPGKTVNVQMTGRLLNLNGIKFYSTKEFKDEFGEAPALKFVYGRGELLPGLEEGMLGMKKGAIRKIVVPPSMGYSQYPNLLPQPSAKGRPSLDSVLKNPRRDSTIVFEVLVEGIR